MTRKGSTGSLDVKDYQSASEAEVEQEMQADEGLNPERRPGTSNIGQDPEQEVLDFDPPAYNEGDLFGDDGEGELPVHNEDLNRRTSDEFDMVPERNYRAGSCITECVSIRH